MPARQQRDQFHPIHRCNNEVTVDDEGENKKKTQMFENDPAYEKFTRLKQEKLNDQLFLAEFHSSTHDNAFAFQTKPICLYHPVVIQH